jgi:hypothetical protein
MHTLYMSVFACVEEELLSVCMCGGRGREVCGVCVVEGVGRCAVCVCVVQFCRLVCVSAEIFPNYD